MPSVCVCVCGGCEFAWVSECVCVKESVGAEEKVCSRRMRQPSTRLVFCQVARLVVDSSSWSFYYCRTLVARAALHIAVMSFETDTWGGRERMREREMTCVECRATGRHLAARQSTQTCLSVFTIIAAMTAVHVMQSKDDAVDNLTQCAAVAQFLRLAASPRAVQDVTTKFGPRVGVGA